MKLIASAILSLLLGCQYALAQSQEADTKENRLSIGLMGGVTTGHLNLGSSIEESGYKNFDVKEQLNSTLGFNIRYAATKDIALQSNVMLGKFSLLSDYFHQEALSFSNNYITTSITTQLSLIRLLGAKSDYVNVYGSFGGGLMLNDVSISTTSEEVASRGITPSDHPSSTFFSTFGGGIRFNLGYRIDSFAQYDYHSGSRDIIDGNFIGDLLAVNGAAETANSWSTVTVGMQYKFGSGSADADWPGVAMRPSTPATTPERDVFEQLEDMLTRQADYYEREMEQLENQVDALRAELAEERRRREEEERKEQEEKEEEEDPYAAILREMQSRIDSLEKALAEERKIAEPPVGQENELEVAAEAETEEISAEEEELVVVFEEIDMDVKKIQPELFETGVSDTKAATIDLKPYNLTHLTMEDLMGLLVVPEEEVPEEEPVAEAEVTELVEETRMEELAGAVIEEEEPEPVTEAETELTEPVDLPRIGDLPGAAIEEEEPEPATEAETELTELVDLPRIEDLTAAIEEEEPEPVTEAETELTELVDLPRIEDLTVVAIEEEEALAAGVEEERISEITFDEIMEFAKSIMIQDHMTADAEDEEDMLAEVYEKITEQEPEIRLLADSLTIIQALNELKRGLEKDSAITISEIPDTQIETPKPEPKEIKTDDTLADMLDERALKTGGTPDVTAEEIIVEHPVEDYLESNPETPVIPSEDPITDADETEAEALAGEIESPVLEEAPSDDFSEDTQIPEDETESETDTPDSDRNNWPVFAAIAALFAGLLFYLSKYLKTEKDLDE